MKNFTLLLKTVLFISLVSLLTSCSSDNDDLNHPAPLIVINNEPNPVIEEFKLDLNGTITATVYLEKVIISYIRTYDELPETYKTITSFDNKQQYQINEHFSSLSYDIKTIRIEAIDKKGKSTITEFPITYQEGSVGEFACASATITPTDNKNIFKLTAKAWFHYEDSRQDEFKPKFQTIRIRLIKENSIEIIKHIEGFTNEKEYQTTLEISTDDINKINICVTTKKGAYSYTPRVVINNEPYAEVKNGSLFKAEIASPAFTLYGVYCNYLSTTGTKTLFFEDPYFYPEEVHSYSINKEFQNLTSDINKVEVIAANNTPGGGCYTAIEFPIKAK